MKQDAAETVAAYCQRRIGSALRLVAAYDDTGVELVYVREDLLAAYDEQPRQLHDDFVGLAEIQEIVDSLGLEDSPLGAYRSTMHVTENAFVFQFFRGAKRGVIVSTDTSIGQQLDSFVNDLGDRLDGST